VTIHDRNKELLRRRKEKYFGASDLGDIEGDYDSTLTYSENVKNMGLGEQHAPTRKEIKQAEKAAYESNISNVTGQTYNSDMGEDETIYSMPKLIRCKGMSIHIDSPLLSDSEAVKRAILVGLARAGEAISRDVIENTKTDFGDDKPEGYIQGDRAGKFPGSYPNASAYYSNKKIPFWRGGLRGTFVPTGQEGLKQFLSFEAGYAVNIENGASGSTTLDGGWVADKLDAYWQTTHDGWKGEVEIQGIHAHPFVAGVAEKIDMGMANYGYLDIFADAFVASMKG